MRPHPAALPPSSPDRPFTREVLALVRQGHGAAFAVTGAAAPAAVVALASVAEQAGCHVLSVRSGANPNVPFAAVTGTVAALIAGRSADDPLFHGAGSLVRSVLTGEALPPGGGDRTEQIAYGFAWLLNDLSEEYPILVCAPELGTLDDASARVLTAVARRTAQRTLWVVAGAARGAHEEPRLRALVSAGAALRHCDDDPALTSPAPPETDARPERHLDPVERALARGDAPATGSVEVAQELVAAAKRAQALGAGDIAITLWSRALQERAPEPERSDLLVELGTAMDRAGDSRAAQVLEEATACATGARATVSAYVARARVLAGRGQPAAATALLRDARTRIPGAAGVDLDVERARHGRVVLAERAEALALAEELLAADTPRSPARRRLFAELALEGVSKVAPGKQAAVARAIAALDGGQLLKEETADGLGWFWAAYALHLAGENETALAVLDAAVADAQRRGSLAGFVQAIALRSGPRFHLGQLRDAAADCEIALAAGAGLHEAWLPAVRSTLMQLRSHLGDSAGAHRIASEQERHDRATGPSMLFLYGRAVMRHSVGEDDAALADLQTAGDQMRLGDGNNPAMMPWRAFAARLLAARGQRESAAQLAQEELGLARAFGADGPIAIAEHAVAVAANSPSDRAALLEIACERHVGGERSCERIAALTDFGAALTAVGDHVAARRPLREALDLAHHAGAEALAEHARSRLVAAGGRPRRPALRGRDALTPSEMRVCELAAAGASNREIAEGLFVSVKTVEWHLTCAYRKLGVQRRSGLAEALHRPSQAR